MLLLFPLFLSASLPPIVFGRAITRRAWNPHRLVVFGDSFSDDGNGAWLASNETWPSDPAYFGHHFSNGYEWNQDLAQTLNVPLLNYASGGATADNSVVQGYTGENSTIPVPSATDQINTFLSNDTVQPSDVFFIYIGANDPLFNTSVTGDQIAAIIESQVHRLFVQGAQQIILLDYPSLDLLPAEYSEDAMTKTYLQTYTAEYNSKLLAIATGWAPYLQITVVQVSQLFRDIFANPAKYGINSTYVDPPTACLQGVYPSEGVPRTLCSDPAQHLFFDAFHPVKQIHARIGALVGQLFEVSVPVPAR